MANEPLIETGFNKSGNCVIVMKPEVYDNFIDELREMREILIETIVKNQAFSADQCFEKLSADFPVSMTLSFHPTSTEFINKSIKEN